MTAVAVEAEAVAVGGKGSGDGIDAPAAADYRTGGRCVAGLRIARSRVGVGSARRQRTRVNGGDKGGDVGVAVLGRGAQFVGKHGVSRNVKVCAVVERFRILANRQVDGGQGAGGLITRGAAGNCAIRPDYNLTIIRDGVLVSRSGLVERLAGVLATVKIFPSRVLAIVSTAVTFSASPPS